MSDIITLSSDDESEIYTKRLKLDVDMKFDDEVVVVNELVPNVASKAYKTLHRLSRLTDIQTIPIMDHISSYRKKVDTTENSLTIVIDSNEKKFASKANLVAGNDNDDVVIVETGNEDITDPDTDTRANGAVIVKENGPLNTSSAVINTNISAVNGDNDTGDSSTEVFDLAEEPEILELHQEQTESFTQPIDIDVNSEPSTSTLSSTSMFEKFLAICDESVKGSNFAVRLLEKFPKIKQYFEICQCLHADSEFLNLLEHHSVIAKSSAADAVCSFQKIFSHLKDNVNREAIEIDRDLVPRVKKLEKAIRLLLKKLKQLEESEVDLDDESDSTYIQIERYSARLTKVHAKYCQLLKQNPYSGRLLYEKLNFKNSNYSEINKAINKACKHNKFPNYGDVEKIVRKCVVKNNLNLSENEVKMESEACFRKLGDMLQLRRKRELFDTQSAWLSVSRDPAASDPALNSILLQNSIENEQKMQAVITKYVKLQENNTNVELSEDSDDSNYKDSEGSDA